MGVAHDAYRFLQDQSSFTKLSGRVGGCGRSKSRKYIFQSLKSAKSPKGCSKRFKPTLLNGPPACTMPVNPARSPVFMCPVLFYQILQYAESVGPALLTTTFTFPIATA